MNDIQQRIAAMSRDEKEIALLELVMALHAENTDRAYSFLRDAGLEQDLVPASSDEAEMNPSDTEQMDHNTIRIFLEN